MKSIFTLILALFIGIQFISAQDQPAQSNQKVISAQPAQTTQPAQATPAAPKTIVWNETIHDFGKIPQNDPASVTFTFNNTGTEPVVITAARSSCGCTVAEYTKEPVKPGSSGTVKATYNSARAGNFTKTVTVTFEGNTNPDVLSIKGEVLAPTTTTPNQ